MFRKCLWWKNHAQIAKVFCTKITLSCSSVFPWTFWSALAWPFYSRKLSPNLCAHSDFSVMVLIGIFCLYSKWAYFMKSPHCCTESQSIGKAPFTLREEAKAKWKPCFRLGPFQSHHPSFTTRPCPVMLYRTAPPHHKYTLPLSSTLGLRERPEDPRYEVQNAVLGCLLRVRETILKEKWSLILSGPELPLVSPPLSPSHQDVRKGHKAQMPLV